MTKHVVLLVVSVGMFAACGSSGEIVDGGSADALPADGGSSDTGSADAEPADASDGSDAEPADASDGADAGPADAMDGADDVPGDALADGGGADAGSGDADGGSPVCGNGIVEPGESCEYGGVLCQNCQLTTCGGCFSAVGGGAGVCSGLSLGDTISCNALVTCMAPGLAGCAFRGNGVLGCYCSDATCSGGANAPCAPQFEALAHTHDPAVVIGQINDATTAVGRAAAAMLRFGGSSCGRSCAGF